MCMQLRQDAVGLDSVGVVSATWTEGPEVIEDDDDDDDDDDEECMLVAIDDEYW